MGKTAYLFLVVKAFVVIFHCARTLLLSSFAFCGIDNVATEEFLPEGIAARAAYIAEVALVKGDSRARLIDRSRESQLVR